MTRAEALEAGATEEAWMPTMHGNTTAYAPEYREGRYAGGELQWTKWLAIPTQDGHGVRGVPYPAFAGGMFKTIGLFGYEQAQALAWEFAAEAASLPRKVETRVVTYEFQYDIKARRIEEVVAP